MILHIVSEVSTVVNSQITVDKLTHVIKKWVVTFRLAQWQESSHYLIDLS